MYPLLPEMLLSFMMASGLTMAVLAFCDVRTRFYGINHSEMLPGVIVLGWMVTARVIDLDVVMVSTCHCTAFSLKISSYHPGFRRNWEHSVSFGFVQPYSSS